MTIVCFLNASSSCFLLFFFFNATATTEIYTLSLHDALPIYLIGAGDGRPCLARLLARCRLAGLPGGERSEEHTSELQSQFHLVCRLLLEKKKNNKHIIQTPAHKTTTHS